GLQGHAKPRTKLKKLPNSTVLKLSNKDSLTLLTRVFEGHPRLVSCCNSYSLWAHNPKVGGSNPPPATNGIIELGEPRFRLPFFSVRVVCAFYWMAARLGIATTLSACAFFHSRRLLCTARCCARFSSSLNRSA